MTVSITIDAYYLNCKSLLVLVTTVKFEYKPTHVIEQMALISLFSRASKSHYRRN